MLTLIELHPRDPLIVVHCGDVVEHGNKKKQRLTVIFHRNFFKKLLVCERTIHFNQLIVLNFPFHRHIA